VSTASVPKNGSCHDPLNPLTKHAIHTLNCHISVSISLVPTCLLTRKPNHWITFGVVFWGEIITAWSIELSSPTTLWITRIIVWRNPSDISNWWLVQWLAMVCWSRITQNISLYHSLKRFSRVWFESSKVVKYSDQPNMDSPLLTGNYFLTVQAQQAKNRKNGIIITTKQEQCLTKSRLRSLYPL